MTIRQLAKLAGLSHTTVSRALRDHPRISLETRKLVQRLAKKHGYAPHPMVSELMAQLPHIRQIARSTLALVTWWPQWKGHIFLKAIHDGVSERAQELGYQVEEFPLHKGEMSPARLQSVLEARGIQGVLVYPFERSPSRLEMDWQRFTGASIGLSLVEPELHRVVAGYYSNMLLTLHELRKLGYRRIALALKPELRVRVSDAYLAAYLLYERELPVEERMPLFRPAGAAAGAEHYDAYSEPIAHSGFDLDPAEVAAWLKQHRADALICNYNPRPELLRKEGIRIPEDLGYAALDCAIATPDVSGIDQLPRQMGVAAVNLVTAHLQRHERGAPEYPEVITVRSRWRPGKTVRAQ